MVGHTGKAEAAIAAVETAGRLFTKAA
jgi:bisphosphoglycerate-independent phosphoglycerate mutase (AlkP superfamily)